MKKIVLSLALIITSFSSLFSIENKLTLESTFKLDNSSPVFLSIRQLKNSRISKIYELSFLSNIDQMTADKIDTFILNKMGVVSSKTDIIKNKIYVMIDSRIDHNDVDFIFYIIRKDFLGGKDTPITSSCEHKH